MKTESQSNQTALVKSNVATLAAIVKKNEVALAGALRSTGIDKERYLRMLWACTREQPKLLECDPESVWGCALTSATMGLEPGAAFGQSYWVPFWSSKKRCNIATHITGYKGLLQHVYRSGQTAPISSGCVYKGDEFIFQKGLDPTLRHVELATDRIDANLQYAWACTKINAEPIFEVMTRDELDGIRKRSRSGDNGPWVTDFPAMCRKTVIKRLCKYLPAQVVPPAIMERMHHEDKVEFGGVDPADLVPAEVTVEPASPPPTTPTAPDGPTTPPAPRPKADPDEFNRVKAAVAKLTAQLPPDISDKILFDLGIDNLPGCQDLDLIRVAGARAEEALLGMEGGA